MWQVIEESLDPKNGEHPVHPSAPYKTEEGARAGARLSAESYPEQQYDPTDKSWLVKGEDGRRIRMYVVKVA